MKLNAATCGWTYSKLRAWCKEAKTAYSGNSQQRAAIRTVKKVILPHKGRREEELPADVVTAITAELQLADLLDEDGNARKRKNAGRDRADTCGESRKDQHKKHKKRKKHVDDEANEDSPAASGGGALVLPDHKYVMAPMVGGSELAFRMLCRRYCPSLLCYTPMIYSERFRNDAAYRDVVWQTVPEDRPLVAHFCGNDPETMLAAAKLVVGSCDAVDINLGCPQRIAHSGHFGSYLTESEQDRNGLVLDIVRTMVTGLRCSGVPVFCKIRLMETPEATLDFCQRLRDSGCSLIALHARYPTWLIEKQEKEAQAKFGACGVSGGSGSTGSRLSATRRRHGAAHLDQVAFVKAQMGDFPILANGNVRCPEDVKMNLKSTGADGIMSAEGILDDPAIFGGPHDRTTAAKGEAAIAVASVGEDAAVAAFKEQRKLAKKLREIERLEALQVAAASREGKGQEGQGETDGGLGKRNKTKTVTQLQDGLTDAERAKLESKAEIIKALAALPLPVSPASQGAPRLSSSPIEQAVVGKHAGDKLSLALEYLECAARFPTPLSTVIFHVRRIAKVQLTHYQLLDAVVNARDVAAVSAAVAAAQRYESGAIEFVPDEAAAARQVEALERKAREEGKRRDYEARMIRKAKREGREDLMFHLRTGLQPPTSRDIETAKAIDGEALRMAWWKERFGQVSVLLSRCLASLVGRVRNYICVLVPC